MILVLAGTTEGKMVAERLQEVGLPIVCSVVSDYGEELLTETGVSQVVVQRLDEASMNSFLQENQVTMVVDATHPFAVNISQLAAQVCAQRQVPYLRYQRELELLSEDSTVHLVEDYCQAAQLACQLGQRIFLTTGSNHLETFIQAAKSYNCQIIARVLPEPTVLAKCRELGLVPQNIVAMQGPFSEPLNRELILHYDADVVVTKNSGSVGGLRAKIEAAKALNLPVVVIRPPNGPNLKAGQLFSNIDQLLSYLLATYKHSSKRPS